MVKGIETSREQWRWVPLERFAAEIRYAAKSLRRNPVFACAVILTLAFGIGANAAIFTLLQAVISRTLPVPAAEQLRLFSVSLADSQGEPIFSYPVLTAMREAVKGSADLAGFSAPMPSLVILGEGNAERTSAQLVSGAFFRTLEVKAQVGRLLTEEDDRASGAYPAVLSDGYWTKRFARDPAVIGRTVILNRTPITVVGVSARGFFGLSPGTRPDYWLPVSAQHDVRFSRNVWNSDGDSTKSFLTQPEIRWLQIVARIPHPRQEGHVAAAVNQIYYRDMQREARGRSDPLEARKLLQSKVHLDAGSKGLGGLRRQFAAPLLVLMSAAALVLLIACANIASLALARAAARQKEFAVRCSIGASRSRIAGQILTETLLLALLGGAASIPVTLGASRLLLRGASNGDPLPLGIGLSTPVLAFLALLSVAVGVVFGLLPATRVLKISIADSLKAQAQSLTGMRLPWGRTLIAVQIAFCFILLTGAVLFVRTLLNYSQIPLGFQPRRVVSVLVDPSGAHYTQEQLLPLYRRVLHRVEQLPGFESAAFAECGLAKSCQDISGIQIVGRSRRPGEDLQMQENAVSPGYFQTVGMRLLQGRVFDQHDFGKSPLFAVINETAARQYFANTNPIGQHFGYGSRGDQYEILGVVADARVNDVHMLPRPMAYYSLEQRPAFASSLEIRTHLEEKSAEREIRSVIRAADPNLPILQIQPLTVQVASNLNRERLVARLAAAFALLALALACLGVYGVLSYAVSRRTSEIGIRIALGAEQRTVRWMVVKEAVLVLAIGLGLGIPSALALTRLIKGLLYGLSPEDPTALVFGAGSLLIIGVAAALLPAWRASRVDPMVALRYE